MTDLIRGLRSNREKEDKFILQCIDEIRSELRRNELDIKTNAVSKLCVLHMMGYDMRWASFHIVEVMASPKLAQKRIGYHAATLCFSQDTDVLLLCTNLIKKDLCSNNYLEGSCALNALAHIVSPGLAMDLNSDVIAMLNHSRPYMRKRAVVTLYRVILKFPEALRTAYPRLRERLEDQDASVATTAVNVVCELARKNPKSYLPLSPILYSLLQTSTNNWMLIKIIKLFAALCLLETRLIKKIAPVIIEVIQSNAAMSVVYECVLTIIEGGMIPKDTESTLTDIQSLLLATCIEKISLFLRDDDQNLKYLGLNVFAKLLEYRPQAIHKHRDTILACLDDKDITIRLKALGLVPIMATQNTLFSIVKRLMTYIQPRTSVSRLTSLSNHEQKYRTDLASTILTVCSQETYKNIADFEWYLSVLVELSACGVDLDTRVSDQIIDVCVRVQGLAESCSSLLIQALQSTTTTKSSNDALYGVAWVVGEYCGGEAESVLECLVRQETKFLTVSTQAVCIQSILKMYVALLGRGSIKEDLTSRIKDLLIYFTTSPDLEVQDRSSTVLEVLNRIGEETDGVSVRGWLPLLFAEEFNPVNPKAQSLVPIPEGLDLDTWIHPIETKPQSPTPWPETESVYNTYARHPETRNHPGPLDPFYLYSNTTSLKSAPFDSMSIRSAPVTGSNAHDVSAIPIVPLELDYDLKIGGATSNASPPLRPVPKRYQLRQEEPLLISQPVREEEQTSEEFMERLKLADPDRYAIMSVDLTAFERGPKRDGGSSVDSLNEYSGIPDASSVDAKKHKKKTKKKKTEKDDKKKQSE